MIIQMKKYLLGLSVVVFFLFATVSAVFADSTMTDPLPPTTPTSIPDENGETPIKNRAIRFLENVYEKSAKLVEHTGADLDRAESIEDRINKAIERQEERGEDIREVQVALDEFLAKMPTMQSSYAEAVEIYEAHAGFDADGKVADIDEATDTMQALKDTLVQTHHNWHEATGELRDVLEAYRDAHPKVEEN